MVSKKHILQQIDLIREQFDKLDSLAKEVQQLEHALLQKQLGALYESLKEYALIVPEKIPVEVAQEPIEREALKEVVIETEKEQAAPSPAVESPAAAESPKNNKGGDVIEKLHLSSIQRIKSGISIGKRYEIQFELFDNQAKAYNEALKQLEEIENLDDALSYLDKTLGEKYNWNPEHPLLDELRLLITRKLQ